MFIIAQVHWHLPMKGPHRKLGWESAHTVECLSQGHGATSQRPGPVPETSRSKVGCVAAAPRMPCMHRDYIQIIIGTLRVATAWEHLVLGGCFSSPSMSVRRHRQWRGHVSHERYTVSSVKGRETDLHKLLPQRASNPGRRRDRPARYHCAIAPFHK